MKHTLSIISGCLVGLASSSEVWSQSAHCLTPPPGMIGWWRGEGDARDSVGRAHGTLVGRTLFGLGVVGAGFYFSGGGTEYVRLPSNLFPFPSVGTDNQPFSFEVWFQTATGGVILGQQDVAPFGNRLGGYEPALYVGTNGQLYAEMFYGNGLQIISTNVVNDNLFHHAAVTYDGTTEILYVDGQAVGSTLLRQRGYARNYEYQLGTGFTGGWSGAPGGWFPFEGTIDEPTLYNRGLRADEVAALFQARNQGKCIAMAAASLLHRYNFNEPGGSMVATDPGVRGWTFAVRQLECPFTNGVSDGSAFTGTGALELKGTNGFLELPPELVSPLSSVTFETWVTWHGPASNTYQRIFDFGASNEGVTLSGAGSNYFMLSPARGDTNLLGFEGIMIGQNPLSVTIFDSATIPILSAHDSVLRWFRS